MKHSCEKKEPRDSVDGVGYGNGTSMVLGEGKKPSGDKVSIRLAYALWTKDRPTLHWCDCCQHHHHGRNSSSNSPMVCRDWEDKCSAADHHYYHRNSWLVVVGNHGRCPNRHGYTCCGW
jgi:hypothetical protein